MPRSSHFQGTGAFVDQELCDFDGRAMSRTRPSLDLSFGGRMP